MSTPILVTDPTGNNNPYLKILGPASFVVGSKGQQSGPGDYYTSPDGVNWTANIGGLSVIGASLGDGNFTTTAGYRPNFIVSMHGRGSFGGIVTQKTQLLIAHDGKTFSISSMVAYGDGANSPVNGLLFNYYDASPVSGRPGFRLALQNQSITQISYMSSYDEGKTWTTDQTLGSPQDQTHNVPSAWGPLTIQRYAKGTFSGQTFYVAAVGGAGNGNIYGGTTKPVPPINSIPSGWNLLFATANGAISVHMAVNLSSNSNTVFVIDDSVGGAPSIVTGTGASSTWQEIALSGSLQITGGVASDTTTWVYS